MNCTQYGIQSPTLPSAKPSHGLGAVYHRVSDNPKMTKRRRGVLEFIRDFQQAHQGMPPSIREIGEAIGLASSSTVHCHLHALVKMGELEHDPAKPRSYRLASGRRVSVADLETEIRELEAELEQAYQAGWAAGHYSYPKTSWAEHKRLCVETFTDAQGCPQGVNRGE